MGAVDTEWEEFPSYFELASGIQEFLVKSYRETFVEPQKSSSLDFAWRYFTNFTSKDILFIILSSIIWTILRHLATEIFFKPLAIHYALTPTNQEKMPESAWKCMYFSYSWSFTLYIVALNVRYKFFQKPSTVWDNWSLEEPLPTDIYFLYMSNFGWCLHSIYATLFLDIWRNDYLAMVMHHIATLLLLIISFSLRYHNIGCLVVFTHDACDIMLEFSKLNVYFRTQGGKYVKKHEIIANISFLFFTIIWIATRLTCYPLRVLYTATTIVQEKQFDLKCALLVNSLLWTLQILNLYWFLLILRVIYRVVTGRDKEIDDTREYDVVKEKLKLKPKPYENGIRNRNAKTLGSCDDSSVSNDNLIEKVRNTNKKLE